MRVTSASASCPFAAAWTSHWRWRRLPIRYCSDCASGIGPVAAQRAPRQAMPDVERKHRHAGRRDTRTGDDSGIDQVLIRQYVDAERRWIKRRRDPIGQPRSKSQSSIASTSRRMLAIWSRMPIIPAGWSCRSCRGSCILRNRQCPARTDCRDPVIAHQMSASSITSSLRMVIARALRSRTLPWRVAGNLITAGNALVPFPRAARRQTNQADRRIERDIRQ